MSTNLDRDGLSIVQYYRARYQMEFVFRDAKQYTGLEHCQARDEEKLNYHFNASLTSVNIAKGIARKGVKKDEEINISISDIKIELSNRLLLDLFISNYGIDPNLQKIGRFTTSSLTLGKMPLKYLANYCNNIRLHLDYQVFFCITFRQKCTNRFSIIFLNYSRSILSWAINDIVCSPCYLCSTMQHIKT